MIIIAGDSWGEGYFPGGHPGADQYQKIYQFLK